MTRFLIFFIRRNKNDTGFGGYIANQKVRDFANQGQAQEWFRRMQEIRSYSTARINHKL